MIAICPTITAKDIRQYFEQIGRVAEFAKRIHVDLADGDLAPKLISPENIVLPSDKTVDVHLMYKNPLDSLNDLMILKPHLIIVHAEAEGELEKYGRQIKDSGIKFGVALLPKSEAKKLKPVAKLLDHVLIFSGHLGHYGGQADLKLLNKVKNIKKLGKNIEIAWDGGINDENAVELARAGVEVFDVGGFIQHSADPQKAYATLKTAINRG